MDLSLTLNMMDVANYIAKYASKSESATRNYIKIFQQLVSEDLLPEASAQKIPVP